MFNDEDSNLKTCDRKLSTLKAVKNDSGIVKIKIIKKITYFIVVKFQILYLYFFNNLHDVFVF